MRALPPLWKPTPTPSAPARAPEQPTRTPALSPDASPVASRHGGDRTSAGGRSGLPNGVADGVAKAAAAAVNGHADFASGKAPGGADFQEALRIEKGLRARANGSGDGGFSGIPAGKAAPTKMGVGVATPLGEAADSYRSGKGPAPAEKSAPANAVPGTGPGPPEDPLPPRSGCTLGVDVRLRAIVPVWNASAVAIAIRMADRLVTYQQYEQYWETRPQVILLDAHVSVSKQ